jgi:U3 small nucleolar RNA-associated protein 10
VLATSNADEKVRVMAMKELIKTVEGKDVSTIDDIVSPLLRCSCCQLLISSHHQETIRGIFTARLQDTSAAVLETLYSDAVTTTSVFKSDVNEYLAGITVITSSQAKPKRNILRLHLAYLLESFWPSVEEDVQETIFHQVLFPFLLFSKPRQKTAELVWSLLTTRAVSGPGPTKKNGSDWVAGCAELVTASVDFSSVDTMNKINYNVAERIAGEPHTSSFFILTKTYNRFCTENIMSSDYFPAYLDLLLGKLHDENHNSQMLSYLIALSLVKKLSGEHQITFAHRLLASMGSVQFAHIDDMSQDHLALNVRNLRFLIYPHVSRSLLLEY